MTDTPERVGEMNALAHDGDDGLLRARLHTCPRSDAYIIVDLGVDTIRDDFTKPGEVIEELFTSAFAFADAPIP